MANAAGVRAGGAFVEIFAKDGQFQQAMARVQGKLKAVGQTMQRFGTMFSLAGTAMGAPLILAARQASGFEDAILGMRAAAGLTDKQIAQLSDEAMRLSKAMGIDPARIAQAFLELTKAGMSVEDVLAGAGRSAVEFARVSGVEMKRAAEFMKVSMNVFGISATDAVDTLSAAADASETSIEAMVESFSQVGSAGKTFDQTLFGVAQAMAALAKYGITGEEAGTAIKTLLTKLVAPTGEANEALAKLGLSIRDFRDEAGALLPIAQIAGVFERALAKMGGNAEDIMIAQAALVDVFEQRGIKVIGAFADLGEKGFNDIAAAMEGNLPVALKFQIMMSGITGAFEKLYAATQRLSIAFTAALGSSVGAAVDAIVRVMDYISKLITAFPLAAKAVAGLTVGLFALGTALIAGGIALRVAAVAVSALMNPLVLVAVAIGELIAIVYRLSPAFQKSVDGIVAAMGKLDFASAFKQMNLHAAIALTRFAQLFHVAFESIKDKAEGMFAFVIDQMKAEANAISEAMGGGRLFDARGRRGRADDQKAREEETRRLDKQYEDTIAALRKELTDEQKRSTKRSAESPIDTENNARRDPFRKPLGGQGAAPAEAATFDIASAGTFASSILGQLQVGPKIDIRERAAKAQEAAAKQMEDLNGNLADLVGQLKQNAADKKPGGEIIDMTAGQPNNVPPPVTKAKELPWWADQATFEQVNNGQAQPSMSLEDALGEMSSYMFDVTSGFSPLGKAEKEPVQAAEQTDKDLVSASEKTAAATQKAADLLVKILDQARRGGVAFA